MDLETRTEHIAARKQELTQSLDEHVAALEELDQLSSFNFDIATDIHPELIDNTTKAGQERLLFWQELYAKLAEGVPYTAIIRKATDLAPGCYGFGKKEEWIVDAYWIRIYKDLPPEAIVFSRDEQGTAIVHINHPSELMQLRGGKRTITEEDSNTLFTTEPRQFSVLRSPNEVQFQPKFYFVEQPSKLYGVTRSDNQKQHSFELDDDLINYSIRQSEQAETR